MNLKRAWKNIWDYLKADTWHSWLVSMILLVILIKFIIFPILGLILATKMPFVIVESCSMYHESSLDEWWSKNAAWYESKGIDKEAFYSFPLKRGLNKGDIMILTSRGGYKVGDILVFPAPTKNPIIHRIVTGFPVTTKGDHNSGQISFDLNVPSEDQYVGKAVFKIPLLGWAKLIFFEPFRSESERGFCQ